MRQFKKMWYSFELLEITSNNVKFLSFGVLGLV